MSKRRPSSDEGSIPPPEAGQNQEHELPSLVVTRTRSGRRVRTPAALLDSQVPSIVKAPSRRTRKSVIQEECTGNTDSGSEGVGQPQNEPESTEPTSLCTGNTISSLVLEPETKKPKVDPNNACEVNHTADQHLSEGSISNQSALQIEELLRSDIRLETNGSKEKENHACPETQVELECLEKKSRHSKLNVKPGQKVPLGKPKSGRVWKDRNKQRFSALLRDKPLRSSWDRKMVAKREKEMVKKFALQLKEEKAREKEDKRKRREENLKRREENERKAEVVQVIRNTAKIKRMKKKQLRKIEKRDTLTLLKKSQSRNQNAARKGSKGTQ
ncbi:hypothetical protein AAFF_G00323360 [Aldrovandia affinis]|uniref:Coiled-coil domain-containing protein 86 n=1 Tax=Aldrovandia affinis TaxID=143900 RepID=A0AAD7R986_9TELE|nr:hypothetical protein AAFF_G00323360 [Aldrovandia affinis]